VFRNPDTLTKKVLMTVTARQEQVDAVKMEMRLGGSSKMRRVEYNGRSTRFWNVQGTKYQAGADQNKVHKITEYLKIIVRMETDQGRVRMSEDKVK
jgi:hypothetical protein